MKTLHINNNSVTDKHLKKFFKDTGKEYATNDELLSFYRNDYSADNKFNTDTKEPETETEKLIKNIATIFKTFINI